MIEVKKNQLFMKNPNTGLLESVSMLSGESAYLRDKRRGYKSSETKWLEDIGCSGGTPELAGEAEYSKSIETTEVVGSKNTPVYINENGIPTPIKYVLGDACELEASDNPKDVNRALLTNIALKEVLDEIINNEYDPNAKAVVPTPTGKMVYDGTVKSPIWVNYDPDSVEIAGVISAINAGNYTAVFTPKSPYTWRDGTRNSVNVVWSIEKTTNTINDITGTYVINELNPSHTFTIQREGNGEIKASSSDPNVLRVTVSGDKVIVTGDGSTSGNGSVYIYVDEDTNHKVSNTIIIDMKVEYVEIVSWSGGSLEAIEKMLEAHYSNIIDVTEYWDIGDKRTVTMNVIGIGTMDEEQASQDIELVIIGMSHDTLSNPINGVSKSAITVQAKNALKTSGIINEDHDDSNSGLWSTCKRRTWCNNDFFNALPVELTKLIRPVVKLTNRCCETVVENYKNYITQQNTTETIYLLSDREIGGESSYFSNQPDYWEGLTPDGEQYEYYETTTNRIKSSDGVICSWFLRTSVYNKANIVYYAAVKTDGGIYGTMSDYAIGIVPAFSL